MSELLRHFKAAKGTPLLVIGLVAGLLLLILGMNSDKGEDVTPLDTQQSGIEVADAYFTALEQKLTLLLEKMDGISEVNLVITADSDAETVYAHDTRYEEGLPIEESYVTVEVNGEKRLIPVKHLYPAVRGIAVVCRGGSNPINQQKIITLLTSLTGLPSTRVYVTG